MASNSELNAASVAPMKDGGVNGGEPPARKAQLPHATDDAPTSRSQHPPLPLGTRIKPYGKIAAILLTGGERYYLFSKGRCVSMIPAFMVETNK